jgi:hypothetical protein
MLNIIHRILGGTIESAVASATLIEAKTVAPVGLGSDAEVDVGLLTP